MSSIEQADAEIARAHEYISRKTAGQSKKWFAYPYGQWNAFLSDYYLPVVFGAEVAFTTGGEYLSEQVHPYRIPRFVCGEHWQNPADFIKVLDGRASVSSTAARKTASESFESEDFGL